MTQPITIDELAEWLRRKTPLTFDAFETARAEGDELGQRWCRGRIDALFQIMNVIDKDGLELLRADWRQRVGDADSTSELGSGGPNV